MIRAFDGKTPRIAATAFVSEAAYVIGDVEIGENSSVWPGAIIRGDFGSIKIGSNTQVEDNCVLHTGIPLLIGDNVHIGHGAVIHCSRVGNNVLIGINAILLDNVEVGDFCVIGANSMVAEGVKIPDRSFAVGTPAKVIAQVSEAQIARIEMGVKAYLEMTLQYKQHGL